MKLQRLIPDKDKRKGREIKKTVGLRRNQTSSQTIEEKGGNTRHYVNRCQRDDKVYYMEKRNKNRVGGRNESYYNVNPKERKTGLTDLSIQRIIKKAYINTRQKENVQRKFDYAPRPAVIIQLHNELLKRIKNTQAKKASHPVPCPQRQTLDRNQRKSYQMNTVPMVAMIRNNKKKKSETRTFQRAG